MKTVRLQIATTLLALYCAAPAQAQQSQPAGAVPRLVRFSGSYRAADGGAAQTVESVTLAVYRDQTGGNAMWREIQNVAVDADGHYSALMGVTLTEGMPLDLFAAGEPRWLGVQFNRPGEAEQARVLLVSVPYALKAADAETLGGKPASSYLLAVPAAGTESGIATSATTAIKPKAVPANNGLPNYIGMFANTTDLIDSAMYQVNGNIGISTTTPLISLDARTGSLPQMGIAGTTDYLTFFASDKYGPAIYWDPAKDMRFGKGGSTLYSAGGFVEQMRIKSSNGDVGIGTMTPISKLDVAGDINFSGIVRFQGSPVLELSGSGSAGLGLGALQNSGPTGNTAVGYNTLNSTSGTYNTAMGFFALANNTSGADNTALGNAALQANTTGNFNIAIGVGAATNVYGGSSNNIHIGSAGASGDSGIVRIGRPGTQTSFFAAGVRNVTTDNNDAIPVVIDSAGQLGTVSSSRRYKEDIADMGAASHDLMRLRPVTFRYQKPFAGGSKPIQYGLIAEEVAEVYPDLVAHSADGQIETVKYQVLDSMLLNEVQRQQAEIGAQKDQLRLLTEQMVEQRQQNQSLQQRLARLEAALSSVSGDTRVSSNP